MKLDIDTRQTLLKASEVRRQLSNYCSEDIIEDEEAFRCWAVLDDLIRYRKCTQLIKNRESYSGSKVKYDCAIDINGIDFYPLV